MTSLRLLKCKNGHTGSVGCCVYEDSYICEECGEDLHHMTYEEETKYWNNNPLDIATAAYQRTLDKYK